jgi:hypothetical protein
MSEVEKTIATAGDALTCKASISALKYVRAPMTEAMCRQVTGKPTPQRRSPIMHRGYFARMEACRVVVNAFMEETASSTAPSSSSPSSSSSSARRQVLLVGSGYDTLSLSICADNDNVRCFEVDFPEVVEKKVDILSNGGALFCPRRGGGSGSGGAGNSSIFRSSSNSSSSGSRSDNSGMVFSRAGSGSNSGSSSGSDCVYASESLALVGRDLRDASGVVADLLRAGLDPTLPTLVITECVLVYVEQQFVLQLCSALSALLAEAAWMSYDMISPHDAFGKTMQRNLSSAGYSIPGFAQCPDLAAHVDQFVGSGWDACRSCTMLQCYKDLVSATEQERVGKIERFDEFEEWNLLMSHYCLSIASKGALLWQLPSLILDSDES